MNLTEEQRQHIIPELEDIQAKALSLEKDLSYIVDRYNYDTIIQPSGQAVYKFISAVNTALRELKEAGCKYITDYITVWYTGLHYDMSDPLVEIAEEDVKPPRYESTKYLGSDEYEIIMHTPTHGKERVIVHSNSATWCHVYSSDRIN